MPSSFPKPGQRAFPVPPAILLPVLAGCRVPHRQQDCRRYRKLSGWASACGGSQPAQAQDKTMPRVVFCILLLQSLSLAQRPRILIVTDLEGAGGVNDADEQL